MTVNIWPCDGLDPFTTLRVVGDLVAFDPTAFRVKAPARHYLELANDNPIDGGPPCLWRVFGDIRQLGVTDSVRRALLRGENRGTFRMVLTASAFNAAKASGRGPTMPYTVLSHIPAILSPGLPCTVMAGPAGSPLEGHRVLVVDPAYRHVPLQVNEDVLLGLKRGVSASLAKHLKGGGEDTP